MALLVGYKHEDELQQVAMHYLWDSFCILVYDCRYWCHIAIHRHLKQASEYIQQPNYYTITNNFTLYLKRFCISDKSVSISAAQMFATKRALQKLNKLSTLYIFRLTKHPANNACKILPLSLCGPPIRLLSSPASACIRNNYPRRLPISASISLSPSHNALDVKFATRFSIWCDERPLLATDGYVCVCAERVLRAQLSQPINFAARMYDTTHGTQHHGAESREVCVCAAGDFYIC
jgi:hypothetical protein